MPNARDHGPDCVIDTDDEDDVICPPCVTTPWQPSPEIVARHNLTHLPYMNWCPHCVAAKRNNDPHFNGSAARSDPLIVLDYCFLRDGASPDNLTTLVGRLYPSRALFAVVCDYKGAYDDYVVTRLCTFL